MKNPFYFTHHVTESIGINRERKPFYSKLTKGKSDPAFRLLLTIETVMIPSAWFWDQRAGSYLKSGIPFMKDELVSMNRTPAMDLEKRIYPEKAIAPIPWKEYQRRISLALNSGNSKTVVEASHVVIQEMSSQPLYYPLTRHLVESIYRFAYFIPLRERESEEKKVKAPTALCFSIMKYHLFGFWNFVLVDKLAAPVHQMGIPMIQSELPDLLADLK